MTYAPRSVNRSRRTRGQIEELDLPYRPVKASDPRTARFADAGSVETEAIPRDVILDILRDRIEEEIDADALDVVRIAERSQRAILTKIAETMAA